MAFLSIKPVIFVFVLAATLTVLHVPKAEAQLGLGGLTNGLLGLIRINGTLFCTANGNIGGGGGGSLTPAFPNAGVQLQCGGNVVSSTTTNAAGVFSIMLNPLQMVLSSLLNNCNLVVSTPLASCNAGLPNVGNLLSSPLQVVGSTVQGVLSIVDIIPAGFQALQV